MASPTRNPNSYNSGREYQSPGSNAKRRRSESSDRSESTERAESTERTASTDRTDSPERLGYDERREAVPTMDTAIDLSDPQKALDLNHIRATLIRAEETIIFHLIERVQFPLNRTIYQAGALENLDPQYSFFDWTLRERERLDSRIRRFESPDEHEFFKDALEEPILKPLRYPKILHENTVNINDRIKKAYIDEILPQVCKTFEGRGDRGETQENYGSAATADISCLQALSRRIHFGKFVAESKFQKEEALFTKLIQAGDTQAIGDAITKPEVEKEVLRRIRSKTEAYSRDPSDKSIHPALKINVDEVVRIYEDFVIPLTKVVEVDYLMQRLLPAKEI